MDLQGDAAVDRRVGESEPVRLRTLQDDGQALGFPECSSEPSAQDCSLVRSRYGTEHEVGIGERRAELGEQGREIINRLCHEPHLSSLNHSGLIWGHRLTSWVRTWRLSACLVRPADGHPALPAVTTDLARASSRSAAATGVTRGPPAFVCIAATATAAACTVSAVGP